MTALFERKPGETEVRLRLEKPRDFSVILDPGVKVRPDREFRAESSASADPRRWTFSPAERSRDRPQSHVEALSWYFHGQ